MSNIDPSDLEKNVLELNRLILRGETLQAMELFYADDVIMQENEDEPRKGKQICIEHEKKNLENTKDLEITLLNQSIDLQKEVVLSELEIVFTKRSGGRFKLTEVSVQHWLSGQIIRENFIIRASLLYK